MISRVDLPEGFEIRSVSNNEDVGKIIELCCQTWGEEGRPFVESVILNHSGMKNDGKFY
jgi:hypothetical protein